MREEYDYLTDSTKEVLTDKVKAVASGWDKCKQYVYGILQGERRDPFAYFVSLYKGVLAGGVSTQPWDAELAYLRERHSKSSAALHPNEAFRDTFHGHSQLIEQYMAAIEDGAIDADETQRLLDLVAIEKPLIETLEKALMAHKAKLELKRRGVR